MNSFELIKTEGYGLEVVFSFKGRTYRAMDDLSGFNPERVNFNAKAFSILCLPDQSWESILQGNPESKIELMLGNAFPPSDEFTFHLSDSPRSKDGIEYVVVRTRTVEKSRGRRVCALEQRVAWQSLGFGHALNLAG